MLGLFVRAKDAHVGAALCTQLFGKHRKVHSVAAGVHRFDMLVFIYDVIAKAEHFHVVRHGFTVSFLKMNLKV